MLLKYIQQSNKYKELDNDSSCKQVDNLAILS